MKKKLVECTPPIPAKKMNWWITVQQVDNIVILNGYNNRFLQARHCINADTGEYATLRGKIWGAEKVQVTIGSSAHWWFREEEKKFRMSREDETIIRSMPCIQKLPEWKRDRNLLAVIDDVETDYSRRKRERTEEHRQERVLNLMQQVPDIPDNLQEWIDQKATQGEDYAIRDPKTQLWSCSGCGEEFASGEIPERIRKDRDSITCPRCGKRITYLARKKIVQCLTHICILQKIDDTKAVARHFDALIECSGGKKKIGIDEAVRLILPKDRGPCEIYYNQYPRGWPGPGVVTDHRWFDNRSNRANRIEGNGYLYEDGIEEALKGTRYQLWSTLFGQMAAAGQRANYNNLMACCVNSNIKDLTELLFRGRFRRLLCQTSEDINARNGGYYGGLRPDGDTIEDTFNLEDRQKINRIRDKDGGYEMLRWMRWSERHRQKISDAALQWLIDNGLKESEMPWLLIRMSPERAMNYIERQKKESYKRKNVKQILSQYEDYMRMCERLGKDTTDAMIYRPRELKRRHDEAVHEIEIRAAELKAEEYSKKFGEAEAVLREIKGKLEYPEDPGDDVNE